MVGVGILPLEGCMQLGVTGPILRSAGLPWDLRKVMPYSGYEDYDFEVPTSTDADCYARFLLRLAEMHESLKIMKQVVKRLEEPGPVMVQDAKIGWPAQLSIGSDGMGNSLEYIRKIMGQSMESLIHHFKLVTEGFEVPAGQAYVGIENPRGELGCHVVSSGGTRPWRVHLRDPGFVNLQAMPAMAEGSMIADVVAAVAIDRSGDGRGGPMSGVRTADRGSGLPGQRRGVRRPHPRPGRGDHRQVPGIPVGTAAVAAPGAVGGGFRVAARDRVLRSEAGSDRRRGVGGCDVLHDVQAHAVR